jgi:hypothetical protein
MPFSRKDSRFFSHSHIPVTPTSRVHSRLSHKKNPTKCGSAEPRAAKYRGGSLFRRTAREELAAVARRPNRPINLCYDKSKPIEPYRIEQKRRIHPSYRARWISKIEEGKVTRENFAPIQISDAASFADDSEPCRSVT